VQVITIGDIPGEGGPPGSNFVRLETGRGLNEWLAVLDAWQGERRKLHSLTHHLTEQHRVEYGCAQVIALYYLCKRL
jgi:hypothetical protein